MNVKYLLKSCYWEKLTFSKLWSSKSSKFSPSSVFGGAPTHLNTIEFENLSLPVSYLKLFWAYQYMHLLCISAEPNDLHHGWGACKKPFWSCLFRYTSQPGLRSFWKPCFVKNWAQYLDTHTDSTVRKPFG